MGHSRIASNEIVRRGQEWYEQTIRPQVETEVNIGKQIVIDVETGAYEIAEEGEEDGLAASRRLRTRHPNAALYGARIGYDAVYALGGVLTRTKR